MKNSGEKEQFYPENNLLRQATEFSEYLSIRDVAEILEVTPQVVRRYCEDGKIEARQRIESNRKWLISTAQFSTHPNWNKYMEKRNNIKKQSVHIAKKVMQYLEEDVK